MRDSEISSHRIDRRSMVAAILGGGLALAVSPAIRSAAATATPAASPVATAFPLTIETTIGTAVVPSVATRVIALSYPDVDTATALGITPIAVQPDTYAESKIPTWLAGKLAPEDTHILDLSGELPLEDFVALKPDLILDTLGFRVSAAYDQVAAIAPTVGGLPAGTTDALTTRTRLIGQLLGKEADAEAALAATNAAIDGVAETYPTLAGLTYAYGYVRAEDNIGVITDPANFTTQLFARWGMSVAPALLNVESSAGAAPGGVNISWEQINLLDADVILLGFVSPDVQTALESSPLFTQLAAVQNERYLALTQELTVAIQVPSVANLPWVVEQLSPFFASVTGA